MQCALVAWKSLLLWTETIFQINLRRPETPQFLLLYYYRNNNNSKATSKSKYLIVSSSNLWSIFTFIGGAQTIAANHSKRRLRSSHLNFTPDEIFSSLEYCKLANETCFIKPWSLFFCRKLAQNTWRLTSIFLGTKPNEQLKLACKH